MTPTGASTPRLHPFTRRVLTATAIALAALALVVVVWQARSVVLLLLAAVLVAAFLRGLGDVLAAHTPLRPDWALLVVVLGLCVLFALLVWLRGPTLIQETGMLSDRLPRALDQLRRQVASTEWGARLIAQLPAPGRIVQEVAGTPGDVIGRITGVASTALSIVAEALIVVVIAIYLAAQPRVYVHGFVQLIPPAQRDRVARALDEVGQMLRRWLVARVGLMMLVGVVTGLGLWWLGIPFPVTLGLIAALLDFVPNFGPIVAAAPAVLLGFLQGPLHALLVVLLYAGYQTVDGYVLTPLLQQRAVSLPPALLLAAQVLLGVLAGPLGLALAAPIAAIGLLLTRRLYIEGALEGKGKPIEEHAPQGG